MPEIKNILDINRIRKSVGLEIKDFDEELQELELAAINKLVLSGIKPSKISKEDTLITTTILAYIKSQFRFSDKDVALRFQDVFEENKNFMRSTSEYTLESSESDG